MDQKNFPLDKTKIDRIIKEQRVDIEHASIRQVNLIVQAVEKELGVKFIRMEFGVPGFPSDRRALEKEAEYILKMNVTANYPPFNGTEEFRNAASKFVKMFMDIDVPPSNVVATCGAQQGCFISLFLAGKMDTERNCILFIDPGFSVNKLQIKVLGLKSDSVDLYERETFLDKLEKRIKKDDIAAVLWSSPNNPSWNVISESELKRMGEMFTKYDVLAIEDNAYFGMDFRVDYSKPGVPPFVPTIAKYTDNYVALLSSSKIFNYAGQRVGCAVISPKLSVREFPNLKKYFAVERFLDAFVQGGVYPTTSGVAHSSQLAVAFLMNEASEGRFNFLEPLKAYGERAKFYKTVMLKNGFNLVYKNDGDKPLADGFYFTASYPKMSGPELLQALLYYGISVTTLNTFGSSRNEGVRICVSIEGKDSFDTFRERIEAFAMDHKRN